MRESLRYRVAEGLNKIGLGADLKKSPAVRRMQKELSRLKNHKMLFRVEIDKDGNWVAEAVDFPGLITGGSANDSFAPLIDDAIFTYFEIPPKYCVALSAETAKAKNKQIFAFSNAQCVAA